MKSQQAISDAVAIARRIVTHFQHSTQACEALSELQRSVNIPENKLIQDVASRWNSTIYMVEWLLEQHKAIVLYLKTQGRTINKLDNVNEENTNLQKSAA